MSEFRVTVTMFFNGVEAESGDEATEQVIAALRVPQVGERTTVVGFDVEDQPEVAA